MDKSTQTAPDHLKEWAATAPKFATVMKVARALGHGLAFKRMPAKPAERRLPATAAPASAKA